MNRERNSWDHRTTSTITRRSAGEHLVGANRSRDGVYLQTAAHKHSSTQKGLIRPATRIAMVGRPSGATVPVSDGGIGQCGLSRIRFG